MQSNFYHNCLYYLSPNGQPAFGQVPLSPNLSPFSYINFLKVSEDQLKRSNPPSLSLDQCTPAVYKAQDNDPELNSKSPKQSFSPFEKLSEATGFGISPGLGDSLVFAEPNIPSPGTTKTNPIIPTPIRVPINIQQKQEIPQNISKLKAGDQAKEPKANPIIESPHVYYSTLLQKIDKEDAYFQTTDDLIRKMQVKQQRAKLQKLRGNNRQKKNRKTGRANLQTKESSNSESSSKLQSRTHRIQKSPLSSLLDPDRINFKLPKSTFETHF